MIETPGLEGDSTIATSKISAPKQYFSCPIALGLNDRNVLTVTVKPSNSRLQACIRKLRMFFDLEDFNHIHESKFLINPIIPWSW
jgi:hypothetical protein